VAFGLSTFQQDLSLLAFYPTDRLAGSPAQEIQYATLYNQSPLQALLNFYDTVQGAAQPGGGPALDVGDPRTQQVTLVDGRLVSGEPASSSLKRLT
jgi:hypothetical protein